MTSPMDVLAGLNGKNMAYHSSIIQDFLKTGGQNLNPQEYAWCAAAVNSSLAQAGMKGTGSDRARSFLDWGTAVTEPQRGDVAVFSRGDPNGPQGHVGFFDGYVGEGPDRRIRVLGGNQSNGVNFTTMPESVLLGFRRAPDGSGEAPTAVADVQAKAVDGPAPTTVDTNALAQAYGVARSERAFGNNMAAALSSMAAAPQQFAQTRPSPELPASFFDIQQRQQQAQTAPRQADRALPSPIADQPLDPYAQPQVGMMGVLQRQQQSPVRGRLT